MDASVVAKLVLTEEQSGVARALYFATIEADVSIVAPPLLLFEVTNIVRQQMRRQRIPSLAEAHALLAGFLALPIEIHAPPGMHQRALSLADEFDLLAAYDAHYLALAERLDCEFWTNDQRLLRQVGDRLPFVRWLGDYSA